MKRSILAADPVTLPNGQRVSLIEFLSWQRNLNDQNDSNGPVGGRAPSCTVADIFTECFEGATPGTIDGGAPGPLNGWTFIEPFGALGGEFNFTPGVMSMDTAGAAEFPIAVKPLPAPLASVFNITGQFDFTEYATTPNATTTYQLIMNNNGITESISVSFFGDGSVAVQAGDSTTVPTYAGAWIPSPGSAHVVHFSISALGVPLLWLDDVPVPLLFIGNVGTFFASYPSNNISWGGGAGDAAAAVSPIRNLFIASGVLPPSTVFCC